MNLPETTRKMSLYEFLKQNPQPLEVPCITPTLIQESFLVRVALSIEYAMKKIEYALSANGKLRFWMKFCLLVLIYIATPLALFTPVLNYAMSSVVDISYALWMTSLYGLQAFACIAAIALICLLAFSLIRYLLR